MEQVPNFSTLLSHVMYKMHRLAFDMRHEYVTPEHLLAVLLLDFKPFYDTLGNLGADTDKLLSEVTGCLDEMEQRRGADQRRKTSADEECYVYSSFQMATLLEEASETASNAGRDTVMPEHLVSALLHLPDNTAAWLLQKAIDGDTGTFMLQFLDNLASCYPDIYNPDDPDSSSFILDSDNDGVPADEIELPSGRESESQHHKGGKASWHKLVTCLNDSLTGHNPLIGREEELARTIHVLCRKDKNNPIHVGEPGVGKTALVYGLARLINEGKVPEALQGARIYQIDLSSLLAGTQFRGELEKRLKLILDGAAAESNAILYIDEIHNLVGTGAVGESPMDLANMLKPYLENGSLRFIGSTTYDEYKRHFARSKGLSRRFRQIDVPEPSVEEAIHILMQLKGVYEEFHGVVYPQATIEYAVRMSARHINERFLPDKAIDLIDEAGAYRAIHPLPQDEAPQSVDISTVSEILAKICKVDTLAVQSDDDMQLESLPERIAASIYGQDEAVRRVAESVMMAKAGLRDESKPLASLLFVGPTGVGKTEVARVLASELGVELVRFDMSEYTEKHTVAKLIGAPAGYVGYEDGGLLTDAIRRHPDCVLLLDELEKAHSDIYNILLQVMDYARLTDNKGNRADFRNVVLIMTSNAGAQYASQASVGFGSRVTTGDAMMREVKRTFKPEFLNRLTATVIFNDMDRHMASLILDKKLAQLQTLLEAKKVTLDLAAEARGYLLEEGFTREYGAREIDRVITSQLKPLLMREILFGRLKHGGTAHVGLQEGRLHIISCNLPD